jgi:DeoR/GlpR family transcriptional regulator of sugar metabolism
VVKELAQKFELSVDSIRRDLTIMEEQGLLKKFYGGAVPASQVRVFPQPEAIRYGEPDAAHDAISKLAASYIQANDSVFIGGAGIQYGMLRHLPRHFPLTVVTNSLKIAQTIREWENVDAFLIGGKLRASSGGSIIDPLAIETNPQIFPRSLFYNRRRRNCQRRQYSDNGRSELCPCGKRSFSQEDLSRPS